MTPCLRPAGHPVASLARCCGRWGLARRGRMPWCRCVPYHRAHRAGNHAVPVCWLEQRLAERGLPCSIPIPGAHPGTSPSLCRAAPIGCRGLGDGGRAWLLLCQEAPPGRVHQQRPCPGVVCARGDGVLGRRGLLAPRPPSADAAANIPSWLFIFRIPWQGRDCKQLIFSQGHLHPMALPRSHRGVAGCPEPLRTRLTPAPGPAPRSGAVGGSRGHPGSALCRPQVPARRGGDAQPHRGEGPGAGGG